MRHELLPALGSSAPLGLFGGSHPAALTIESGDEIALATLGVFGGRGRPEHDLATILALRSEHPDRGPHTLTGPIEVVGAHPGDALRVDILDVVPEEHGFTFATPVEISRGVLAAHFPAGFVRHFRIDPAAGTATSGAVTVPIRAFPGFVGVAPDDSTLYNSIVPGHFGGNLDVRDLVPGSSIFLPVLKEGGWLYLGDGHAAQGDGEVCGPAIECGLAHLSVRVTLERGLTLRLPRLVDSGRLIAVGLGEDLGEATREANAAMVEWLGELGLPPEDAYLLIGAAGTMNISQVVNGIQGVHLGIGRDLVDSLDGADVWRAEGERRSP